MIQDVLEKIRGYNEATDSKKISRAFELLRKDRLYSEKNYFQSLGVVQSLLPMKPDDETVIAAALYSLYDSGLIDDEFVLDSFGQVVLGLLVGVNKLKGLNYSENDEAAQLEDLRKMFLTMAKDIRVVLIKLAVRLYKMAHLEEFIPDKIERMTFAKETFDVYVPVASRLGIYRMKIDLEDMSFMCLNPVEYESVSKQIEKLGRSRKIAIAVIKKEIENFVKYYCGYKDAEVFARLKSVYSIYRKLRMKNLCSIDDIYDIFAIRVILPSEFDESGNEKMDHLYSLLGMIHSNWKPITKKFKDYISVPKQNGYKSLHTIVLGLVPEDSMKPVEIQIRSSEMHRHAEYGVASHWIYKQSDSKKDVDGLKSQIDWLKGLEKVHEDLEVDVDIMKKVELDIFQDRIFVLTPRGEIKDLPVGAIPLDFAYAVHTDVGHHCIMAKVNGSIVPLDYELKNGDVVEIVVKKDSLPKLQWLSIVKTNFAKNKIRNWFNSLDRENNVKQGKLLLNKQLERLGLPSLDQNYSVLRNFGGKDLTVEQREGLVEEVGRGYKLAGNVIRVVYPAEEILSRKKKIDEKARSAGGVKVVSEDEDFNSQILVWGEKGLPIKLGACCAPKRKDMIIGYVTRGNKITIHNQKCVLLDGLDKSRLVSAGWRGGRDIGEFSKNYRVKIKIVSMVSRVGLLRDVSSTIASLGIDIVGIRMDVGGPKVYTMYLVLDIDDPKKFDVMMEKISGISDVMQVAVEK